MPASVCLTDAVVPDLRAARLRRSHDGEWQLGSSRCVTKTDRFGIASQPHQNELAAAVIQLLLNCPAEPVTSRKELLVATRHILATDFRKAFFKKIDVLLDENVLIGKGRGAQEVVRPLAYSTLADLIHHVRTDLTVRLVPSCGHPLVTC